MPSLPVPPHLPPFWLSVSTLLLPHTYLTLHHRNNVAPHAAIIKSYLTRLPLRAARRRRYYDRTNKRLPSSDWLKGGVNRQAKRATAAAAKHGWRVGRTEKGVTVVCGLGSILPRVGGDDRGRAFGALWRRPVAGRRAATVRLRAGTLYVALSLRLSLRALSCVSLFPLRLLPFHHLFPRCPQHTLPLGISPLYHLLSTVPLHPGTTPRSVWLLYRCSGRRATSRANNRRTRFRTSA